MMMKVKNSKKTAVQKNKDRVTGIVTGMWRVNSGMSDSGDSGDSSDSSDSGDSGDMRYKNSMSDSASGDGGDCGDNGDGGDMRYKKSTIVVT